MISIDETTLTTEIFKFEEEDSFPIIPNVPHDTANAEKIDDDDLFNFDILETTVKQDMNTDYYHDAAAYELTPVTAAIEMFTEQEQGLAIPSDIGQVTLEDPQVTFERTTVNDIKLDETVTEGEGLRYPTYPY